MYKEKSREKAILKLCTDYSQNPNICDEAEKSACQILQFFIEEKMKNSLKEKDFNLADGVNLCLMPIYKMAKCSHEWIKHFWSERIFGYLNSDGRSNRLDKEILKYVLKNTVPALAIYLPKELCEVADAYWIKIPKQLIDTCCNKMHDGRFSLLECFDVITRVQLLIENMEAPGLLQNFLVMIIAYALTKDEITTEQRSKLCGIWLKGIDGIFNNGSFAFEIGLVSILYKQIEYELEEDIKIQMKKQMFNCLLYRGQQGIITKVSSYLKKYLQQNEKIAQLFFYTIIAIAEDQMACYKYNVNKLCGIGEKIDYQPNRKKPPVWVKRIFEKNGIGLYNSKREEIIQKYLIREKKKDLSTWNIENGDLQTLCYVSNCGLSFDNHEFSMIMRKIFPYLLSIISNVEDYDEFIDVYAVDEVITFISNGLCDKDSSAIVDMLFDLPDFGQMSSDGYELYEEIAAHLLAVYFDAYKNIEIRRKCEVTLLAIEDKISHICELEVRNNLCKMMFLTLGKIHMHDWNELHTEYSYKDKMFLNEIWSKYGWLHFKNLLYVINQMHITELLPEIILPLNESLRKCGENYADCKEMIKANAVIINKIITKAFLDFNDDIKCDHELVKAFEEVLETLVGFGMEEAAVILDEFRVH